VDCVDYSHSLNDFSLLVNISLVGGQNNGMNPSQFVRQTLGQVVRGRSQQPNVGNGNNNPNNNNNNGGAMRRNLASPLDIGPNVSLVDTNANNNNNSSSNNTNNPNNSLMINQQQQLTGSLMTTPTPDLDSSMRQFNFDMAQGKLSQYKQ